MKTMLVAAGLLASLLAAGCDEFNGQRAETERFRDACRANGGVFTPMNNPDDNYCDLPKRD